MSDTNIPFGSEFSPSQIDLPNLLHICKINEGSKEHLEKDILNTYFYCHGNGDVNNKRKLAMNCRIGLRTYGIIDENCFLTELGNKLFDIRNEEKILYDEFAKHILLNLNGMAFIQCIRDMTLSLETINLTTLRTSLSERGIYYPPGGKHPSIMRLWLSKAGIFGNRWQINNERLSQILKLENEMDSLRELTALQRAFLLALANSGIKEEQPANQITKLAEATYGVKFPEKSLPKEVLNNLVNKGFITATKTTSGRGAKPFNVAPTYKVDKDIIIPLLNQLKEQTDPKLITLLNKSVSEILLDINSKDRYIAGLALEALAFKLMRIIGMEYIATRKRAEQTGGAEVDLIFESARLVFSRWQIQCKNTSRVSLEDIAKEVGLTHSLKSNAIIIISTGTISQDARKYSNIVMKDSNLCIVLIDSDDMGKISDNPVAIIDIFQREAKATMQLKKLEL